MALIPQEDIDKVIEASDLVQIASECVPDLKQKSGKFMACCPFHKEKTPSFQIDPNLQLWHCFGCGEGGNLVTFVMKIHDMSFPEAIEFLADKANIELHKTAGGPSYNKSEKSKLMDACKLSAEFYHNQLTKVKSADANAARKYLSSRGIGSDIAKRWGIGFAPGNNELVKFLSSKKFSSKIMLDANLAVKGKDGRIRDRFFNRIMFPINDINGNVIAFGGRIMDDSQPKYLNTGETPIFHKSNVMYGLDKAKKNMTSNGMAIVVEGYTDVISMHEAGINYAVATLGTALTRQHIRILNQHAKQKIVYLFDGDEAGQRAAERALNFIDQLDRPEVYGKRAEIVALTLPDNMDPKEFIDAKGPDSLLKLIETAKPLLQYGIERKISAFDLNVPGNKSRAAHAAIKVLSPIKDSLLAKEYCNMISQATGMRAEDLIAELSKLKKPTIYDSEYQNTAQDETATKPKFRPYSKISALEKELLCVFVRHPEKIKSIIGDSFDHKWSVETHAKIFEYMMSALSENPSISAQDLVMKIHQKNATTANMLTSISKMYDIKQEPERHGKYLVLCLKAESLSNEIKTLKMKFSSMEDGQEKDEAFKNLSELQKMQTSLKQDAKKLV